MHEAFELGRHDQIHQEHRERQREHQAVVRGAQFFVLSAELNRHVAGQFAAQPLQLRRGSRSDTLVRSRPDRFAETTAARCDRMRRTSLGPRPTVTSAMEPSRIGHAAQRLRWSRRTVRRHAGRGRLLLLPAACGWSRRRRSGGHCAAPEFAFGTLISRFCMLSIVFRCALIGAHQNLDLLVVLAVARRDIASYFAANGIRDRAFVQAHAREFLAIESHLDLRIA